MSILAVSSIMMSEYEKALEYGLLSYELWIKNNLFDRAASELINIAVIYTDKDEFAEAIHYLQRAVTLKLKYKEDLEAGKEVIGTSEYFYNKYYFINNPNDSSLADAYINLGTAYERISNNKEASLFLEKALTIKRSIGDKYGEAAALHQIGNIFLSVDDYSTAEWYFLQIIPLLKDIGNKQLSATLYYNLGKINIFNNLLDHAKDYLKESEILFAEIEYPTGQLLVLEQRICIQLIEHNYQTVFELAEYGLQLSDSIYPETFKAEFLLLLGDAYSATYRYPDAIDNYNKSLSISRDNNFFSKETEVLQKLIKLYKKIGNLAEAFACFEQYQELKEKIHTIDSTKYMKNMQILHEVELHKTNEELAKSKITQLEMELIIRQKETEMLNQELSVKSQLMLVQMEETSKFKSEILNITKQLDKAENILRKVKMKLKESPIMQHTWESYLETFTKVHPDFYPLLLKTCPELTSMEVKICILIKSGLKSEEISQILSVSARTVENHRFHLRKKLGLSGRESLGKFLLSL
ncbi:MAG: tetratricopeptide repeat protein [Ignavibacteriae bacterium]|nr:tetratricopeptide repeat protein [Ignavibacteriota bacterium]